MTRRARSITVLLLLASMASACTAERDPARPDRVPLAVGIGPLSGGIAGVMAAADLDVFSTRGLDVELVRFTSGPVCMSALIGGQVPLCISIGAITVVNAVVAGAEVRAVASLVDTIPYALLVSPRIADLDGLAGARLGVARPGTSPEHALRLGLSALGRSVDGIETVPVGEQPQRLAALVAGSIDGTVISPPGSVQVQRTGFRVIADLFALGVDYPHSVVVARMDFIETHPEVITGFLEGIAEGTRRFKTDRDLAVRVLSGYLETADTADLSATYDLFAKAINNRLVISRDGMRSLLGMMGESDASLAGTDPDRFLDMRFAERAEAAARNLP
jgi:ABC-type nitrate/sulfonate/bicarbonate transport system substrate-binding protein